MPESHPTETRHGPRPPSRERPAPTRLLLVSENFHPTNSSGGRLLTDLAVDLAAEGVEVEVLTSHSSYHVEGGERVRAPARERWRGVTVRRLPSTRLPRERISGRLVNELSLCLAVALTALLRPADVLMATSSPPFMAPLLALVARLRGVPFVFVLMDVYPDIAVATGHLRRGSRLFRLWDAVTRFALRRSSRIVVLGRCMERVVEEKLEGRDVPIDIVPNWADSDALEPVPDDENAFFERHPALRGKFVVQYSGNLGRFQDFETLLRAAELTRGRDDVHWLFVGAGARRDWLAAEIERRALANATLLPFQPQSELIYSLNAQDAALIPLEEGAEGLCVPSKLYPVLAVGKPVLAVMDPQAEVALAVREADAGRVVAQGDAAGLAAAVLELADDPARARATGERARQLFLERYDRPHALHRYLEVLRRSTGGGKRAGASRSSTAS